MSDSKAPRPAAKVARTRLEINEDAKRTLELVYFVHLEQAHWADQVLAKYEIGRPHHRVMYWADKLPGISVRELMRLLRITNQALARSIFELVSLGLIEQRYSQRDRRIRQHFLSKKGAALLAKLIHHQLDGVAEGMASLEPKTIEELWIGLEALIRPGDLKWVLPRPTAVKTDELGKGVISNAKKSGTSKVVARKAGNGSGRLDREITSAIKKAGTTRR
jgi:DNA-binding MarR family transcriptional regulator